MSNTLCQCINCAPRRAEGRFGVRCQYYIDYQVAIGLESMTLPEGAPTLYFVGLRPQGRPLPGVWEFPGGKAEPEESLHEALIREWREELGLKITVHQKIWSDVFHFTDGVFQVTLFRVERAAGQEAVKKVHERLAWMTLEALSKEPVIDSMQEIIRLLQEAEK